MSRYAGMYVENAAPTMRADKRVEYELPVLRYPLHDPWHPEGGEQYFAGFWLPYIASEADARQHVADFERTRITPGADPRAECWPFDWQTMRHLLAGRSRAIAEVIVFDDDIGSVATRCIVMDHPLAKVRRVVPEDVARWRDPAHREALTARARAHAALVPGCRATMPKEAER